MTTSINPEVDQWFAEYDNPMKEAMQLTRQVILEADPRISETIKWKAPTFTYKGNLASFQPRAKKFVSLMFHHGAQIPGDHLILAGDTAQARSIRLLDTADIEAKREALTAVVRAWCDWKDE